MTKDKGGKDSRPVIGGIAGRAGNGPGNRGHGRTFDRIRPPQPPRPFTGGNRGGRGGGNSN